MKKFSTIFLLGTFLVVALSCKKGDPTTDPSPSKAINPLKVTASASAVKSTLSPTGDGSLVWSSYDDLGLYSFDIDNYISAYETAPEDPASRAEWINGMLKSGVANISINNSDPSTADFYTNDEAKDWVGGDSGDNDHRYMFFAFYPASAREYSSIPYYVSPYNDYYDEESGQTVRDIKKGVQFYISSYQDGISFGKHHILVDNGGFSINNFDKDDESTWGNNFYTRGGILDGTEQIEFHGMKPITSIIRLRMRTTDGNSYNVRRLEISTVEGTVEDNYGLSGYAYYDLQDGSFKTMDPHHGYSNSHVDIDFDTGDRRYITVGPEATDWFYVVIIPSYKKISLRFSAIDWRGGNVAVMVTKTSPSREVDGVLKEGFFPGEIYSVTLDMTPPQQLEGDAGQYLAEPWD